MKIVINAGHTKIGKGTGANKYLNESKETRKIAYYLMYLLATTDHEVVPAVFDKSTDNLTETVKLSNSEKPDLFLSIHLNASNGKGEGVECYTYKGAKLPKAVSICNNISKLGYKNRGVKDGTQLKVVRDTTAPAILVECCFVDNKNDTQKYNAIKIAEAIYNAIK